MHELLYKENLVIKDFNDFIAEQSRRGRNMTYSSAINMYKGNMWDRGRGYIGPLPLKKDDNASLILGNIKRMFTSRNVISEVVDRAVDGLLSRAPNWTIFDVNDFTETPTLRTNPNFQTMLIDKAGKTISPESFAKQNKKLNPKIREAELILSEVWNSAKLGDALKLSMTQFMLEGEGKLRIYFSRKKLGQAKTFLEASKQIKVQFVENSKCAILDDGDEKLSIVQISKSTSTNSPKYEISFTDESGKSYVASLLEKPNTVVDDENIEQISEEIVKVKKFADVSTALSLDGAIMVDEIKGQPFVTESMLQNNRALNLALSLGVGILIESGYAELITTNVSLKTIEVPDPNNPGEMIQEEVGIERGATSINNLIGEQTVDKEGRVYFESPGVHWKEPSKLDTFIQGESLYERQILAEAKQTFVLTKLSPDASGESQIQSRQDFVKKEQRYKPSLDVHGSWLLNTVLRTVATVAGKDGYFDELSIIFDCKISAGELSADEKNAVISQYTAGLMSRETAITLLGSDDPLIEIDKIRADDEEKLAKQIKNLEATSKFGNMADNGTPKEMPDGSTRKLSDGRTKSKSPNDKTNPKNQKK